MYSSPQGEKSHIIFLGGVSAANFNVDLNLCLCQIVFSFSKCLCSYRAVVHIDDKLSGRHINVIRCLVSRSHGHTDVRVTDLYTLYIMQIFFLI